LSLSVNSANGLSVDEYINQTIADQQDTQSFMTELRNRIDAECIDIPDYLELTLFELEQMAKGCVSQFTGQESKIGSPEWYDELNNTISNMSRD
jgi:hypothetical protein